MCRALSLSTDSHPHQAAPALTFARIQWPCVPPASLLATLKAGLYVHRRAYTHIKLHTHTRNQYIFEQLAKMGLNDFVAFFYGSAQNLQTVTATTAAPVTLASGDHQTNGVSGLGLGLGLGILPHSVQMLKNRKNTKTPKIILNDCPSDVKYAKNLKSAPQLLAALTAPGKSAGVGSENVASSGGGKSAATMQSAAPMATAMGSAAAYTSELDLYRASGLRKKSSFIWNSFRMPRSKKGESRDELVNWSSGKAVIQSVWQQASNSAGCCMYPCRCAKNQWTVKLRHAGCCCRWLSLFQCVIENVYVYRYRRARFCCHLRGIVLSKLKLKFTRVVWSAAPASVFAAFSSFKFAAFAQAIS